MTVGRLNAELTVTLTPWYWQLYWSNQARPGAVFGDIYLRVGTAINGKHYGLDTPVVNMVKNPLPKFIIVHQADTYWWDRIAAVVPDDQLFHAQKMLSTQFAVAILTSLYKEHGLAGPVR